MVSRRGGGGGAEIIDAKKLEAEYDLLLLTIGAREPRDLAAPGRELGGIAQALDFLSLQNCSLATEQDDFEPINAFRKKVLVIGGGDTGSDCVGTANRQGAEQITQIEVMPKPPEHRGAQQSWPLWPTLFKTSSSHLEGCERLWSVNTKSFRGKDGKVTGVEVCKVETAFKNGRPVFKEVAGSAFEIEANLVLLTMGFTHVVQEGLVESLALDKDERGNIRVSGGFRTSNPKVWTAGDSRNGTSLVVRAIADDKGTAEAIAGTL